MAPCRAKLQNKLLYFANIGGGARRAKPQSPHMYQAVRDPLSNLHFNACLSSIITSGTAWLNFTDASRPLLSSATTPSTPTLYTGRRQAAPLLLSFNCSSLSPLYPCAFSVRRVVRGREWRLRRSTVFSIGRGENVCCERVRVEEGKYFNCIKL